MALPTGGSVPWPPEDCRSHLSEVRAHAAWWSGDLTELMLTSDCHHDGQGARSPERSINTGPGGQRKFWQRRANARNTPSPIRAVHAPLAGDIAATSADLLFGEPPDLVVEQPPVPKPAPGGPADATAVPGQPPAPTPQPDPITQPDEFAAHQQQQAAADAEHQAAVQAQREEAAQRQAELEDIVTKTALWSRLLEGAEVCAATGGVYLRCAWDADLADHPLLSVVDQGRAVPDFKWGVLVAVTFWEEVHRDGAQVWRHLERHESRPGPLGNKTGVVLHGLYLGTTELLGDPVPLGSLPATADYEPVVPLPEGMPRPLMVSYVPNVLPNRRHRAKPVGRSDFAGSESFLDSLDEVWTSWMRDVRLAQARIVAPNEFLTPAGSRPGDGKTLDLDQELFTGVEIADLKEAGGKLIELFQPDIRHEAHAETTVKLVRDIVSSAGYSPQTYGIDIDGQAESGTALRVREKKTLATVKRKRGYWTPAIEETVENLMALDAALFSGPKAIRPRVDWPDLTDDPVERAETTGLWHNAQAVSLWERVKARNPHWDEQQIQEEVDRIEGEKKAAMPMVDLGLPEDEEVVTADVDGRPTTIRRTPPQHEPPGPKPPGKP